MIGAGEVGARCEGWGSEVVAAVGTVGAKKR